MRILFLHGWTSVPGGLKPTYLKDHGHKVINPALDDDDFEKAVQTAQAEFDQHQPDVIVGSSRGGAVAMNIESKGTPLVLLCPAWKKWGKSKTVKPNSTILHSRHDDVVPFENSEELIQNSGLPSSALIEIGDDHRLADPEPLAKMLAACLGLRPRVAGCDFGVPKKAGDQAKKIILIEAVRLDDRHYAIEPTCRNERLIQPFVKGGHWKQNRRGWTLPELHESLSIDYATKACSFDFPFSIPLTLLNDQSFAQRLNQATFCTRQRWVEFVSERLSLGFDNEKASAPLKDLSRFDKWRDKQFWQKRSTDSATNGSPPLKHKFQNVFAMTIAGASLLSRLSTGQYTTVLDDAQVTAAQSLFETYPREVANRIGFAGSYKDRPQDCLEQAVTFLEEQGIKLDFDEQVRHFCETYRTSGNDPDGADAFLCLVAAICFYEGMAEMCSGGADAATLKEEAAIIVPLAKMLEACEDGLG